MANLIASIPHSGENLPPFVDWLKELGEKTLMMDVDRYVDQLYADSLNALQIPFQKTEWHRYCGDLNRFPSDIDRTTVEGNENAAGLFSRGFLWQKTTTNIQLMPKAISKEMHQQLVDLIYTPFHSGVKKLYEQKHKEGHKTIIHLDLHSMPSRGTKEHRDPGEERADIVVSDCHQKSADIQYVHMVIEAYTKAGFKVAHNWPYYGGRVSEHYGKPELGHHAIQVELKRGLYMDEMTKKKTANFSETQKKLRRALELILEKLA